jgi:hypothetical protein
MKQNVEVMLPSDFSIQRAVQSRVGQVARAEAARSHAEEIRRHIEQGGHQDLITLYQRDLRGAEQNEREANAAVARWDELISLYQRLAA